jgi:hypothetical protein
MRAYSSIGTVPYTADVEAQIRQALNDAQQRCRTRLVNKQDFDKAIAYINDLPFGSVSVNGGAVSLSYRHSADTTFVGINWYTWRRQKWVYWSVGRNKARKVAYENVDTLFLSQNKEWAYKTVFYDRYQKYRDIKSRRRLRHSNCLLPEQQLLKIIDTDGGMVLVETMKYDRYLCSPLGYVKVNYAANTVYKAAKTLGITLPKQKKSRAWNKIEPLWIMAALSKI